MTSPPPPQPAEPRAPRWRRLRRAARWLGIGLAALVLLLVLLPTIITILPTGRIIGNLADPALGGSMEMKGLRIGWLGHVRVERITLHPDKNRGTAPFLQMEGVDLGAGLLRLATSRDRLSDIRIRALMVDFVRDEDGGITAMGFLPSADPNATPPAPADPLTRIDLDALLPGIALPIDRLRLEIEDMRLRVLDDSGADPVELTLDPARVVAEWRGGTAPLELALAATLNGVAGSLPIAASATLKDWTDGAAVAARNAVATAQVTVGPASDTALLLESVARLGPGDPGATTRLNLAALARLAATVAPQAPTLDPIGIVALTATADLQDPAVPHLTASLSLRDASLATPDGLGEPGARMPLPDLTIDTRAAWSLAEGTRRDVSLSIFTLPLSVMITETPDAAGSRVAEAQMDLSFQRLIEAANATGILARPIPGVSGHTALRARVTHDDASLKMAQLSWTLRPGRMDGAVRELLPAAFPLRGDHLDLDALDIVAALTIGEPRDGRRAIHASANPDRRPLFFAAQGSIAEDFAPDAELDIAARVDLSALWSAATQLDGLPLEDLGGVMHLSTGVTVRDGDAATSSTLDVAALRVAMPAIPGGVYTDDIRMEARTRTRLADPLNTSATVELEGDLLASRIVAESRSATEYAVGSRIDLRLAPMMERFVAPLAPELPAAITGGVRLALDAATTDGHTFALGLGAAPRQGFRVESAPLPVAITSFDIATSATLTVSDEGIALTLGRGHARLEDFLTVSLGGSVTLQGERAELDARTVATLDAPAAVEFLRPLLQSMERGGIELIGGAQMETTVAARAILGETVTLESPAILSNRVTVELPALNYEDTFGLLAIEELSDERTLALTLPSLDPADMVVTESATTRIGYLGLEGVAGVEGAHLSTSTTLTLAHGVAVDVLDAGWEHVTARGGPAELRFPPLSASALVASQFATGRHAVRRVAVSSPGLLSIQGDLEVDQPGESATVAGTAALLGLPEILMVGPDGAMTRLAVVSAIDASSTATLAAQWSAAAGTLRGLAGRIEAQMPRLAIADDAATATMSMTMGLEGDLARRVARATLVAGVEDVAVAAMPMLDGFDLRVEGDIALEEGPDLVLSAFEVASRRLGVSLLTQGRIHSLPPDALDRLRAGTPAAVAALLTSCYATLGLIAEANFARLSPMLPSMELSGDFLQAVNITNRPGDTLAMVSTQTASDLRAAMPGLFALGAVNGRIPFAKYWSLPGAARQTPARLDGRYFADAVSLDLPMLVAELSRIQLGVADTRSGYEVTAAAESFFGGPGFGTLRVEKRLGNPSLYGEFSLTRVDAATFLPSLSRRRLPARSFNAFGVISLELDDQISTAQLLERMAVRIEFADVGPEVLRESLRLMDRTGSHPGIQATLASLRFGTPRSALLDLRNGLLNMSVTMSSPAGVVYTLPVLEKVGIQGLLGAYPVAGLDANLRLTRDALALFLADDFTEVVRAISPEAPAP